MAERATAPSTPREPVPHATRELERHRRASRTFLRTILFLVLLVACGRQAEHPGPEMHATELDTFDVTRVGDDYVATSRATSDAFEGTLKSVVENAVDELMDSGGGTVEFGAGEFDLGFSYFKLYDPMNVTFAGQGIGITTIRNESDATRDTEPFNLTRPARVVVRDMTIYAGGAVRSTSDVLDFDGGNNNLLERIEVLGTRGRGIVFDGKDHGQSADGNVVRDCRVSGVPYDGIELLAGNGNVLENCVITDVGGNGIEVNKASNTADQANKPSNDNVLSGNRIENAGLDGIRINSGSRNTVRGNTVYDSSDDARGRDGIRIFSYDGVVCDDNVVEGNVATDRQSTKTQYYGLKISSSNCHRTVVGGNDFTGNLRGEIYDVGTDTTYDGLDVQAPSVPADLVALATGTFQVQLSWSASTDDVGVAGYELRRDGVSVALLNGDVTDYLDTTVEAGHAYEYEVRARDEAGNWSGWSDTATVSTSTSTVLTFVATDDTHVREDRPEDNYGSANVLYVDGYPVHVLLLKFDIEGIEGQQLVDASLRLYNVNSSRNGGDFFRIVTDDWDEATVTWSTAPEIDAFRFASLTSVRSGNWYEVDVTDLITGDGALGIAVRSDLMDGAFYRSQEGGAEAPEVVVTLAN